MNANRFNAAINAKARRLHAYVRDEFPHMAVNKSKRFIDGNFRAQGWQGRNFEKWKKKRGKGTILIRSGRLRRSIRGESSPYQARIYSDAPYAAVHNRGFRGTVQVRTHTRNRYTAQRIGTGLYNRNGTERRRTIHTVTGTSTVKAHLRKVNTARRQFMPESATDSPVLTNSIKRELINVIKTIFQ